MASQPELTEDDVLGAKLEEPLESATVPALKRWLLCHGIHVQIVPREASLT